MVERFTQASIHLGGVVQLAIERGPPETRFPKKRQQRSPWGLVGGFPVVHGALGDAKIAGDFSGARVAKIGQKLRQGRDGSWG